MESDALKYYRNVNPEDASLSFDLKRMEDVYDRHQGNPDVPHRHGYFTILFIEKAKGRHRIDFHDFLLGSRQIYFIEPGQVHQLVEDEKSYGYVITFSTQFLIQNGIQEDLVSDLFINESYGYSPPLSMEQDDWEEVGKWINAMEDIMTSASSFRYQAVGALLKLFLIQCNNICTLDINQNPQDTHSSVGLIRTFKSLLNQRYSQWHKVSQYASSLHISPDYLNSVLKGATGKGAKEHIQDRIITEARRLFLFSDSSVKEIGYQLGFQEPAHFSNFFKKCIGVSPSTYLKI